MSISHRYSDFGESLMSSEPADGSDESAQEDRLESFETGYQAGWDDAVKSCVTAQSQAEADMAQTLQDMSFTFHEAFAKLVQTMSPLMTRFVTTLLPDVARDAFGPQIMLQMKSLIEAQAKGAIELTVAPQNIDQLQGLLDQDSAAPFALKPEEGLSPGQAYLRVNEQERQIDLDAVLSAIKENLDAFYENALKETEIG